MIVGGWTPSRGTSSGDPTLESQATNCRDFFDPFERPSPKVPPWPTLLASAATDAGSVCHGGWIWIATARQFFRSIVVDRRWLSQLVYR